MSDYETHGAGFSLEEGKGLYACAELRDICGFYIGGERCVSCAAGICVNQGLLKKIKDEEIFFPEKDNQASLLG